MIATSSPHAVHAALWALEKGGTAVDAAIASDAVLGVVQPQSTGVGGDAFALVDDGAEVVGFNGSGASPRTLTAERFAGDGKLADTDALTVTVPGVVDAWSQMSERFGHLPLGEVLTPARTLARNGFPVGVRSAASWSGASDRLRPGAPWPLVVRPGDRVANIALADTLDEIALGGRDAHYSGRFAAAAVDAVASAGGVLQLDDLVGHRGEWVTPLGGRYRSHEVLELPPNGQGAAVLCALAELDDETATYDAPEWQARMMVAIRNGMSAAYREVADPRVTEVPAFWRRGRDTVFTAVVSDGMAVALISSVFMGFGSGIHAAGTALQNRGFGFSLDPGHPNRVAGGKRPFHTIIPGMLRRDDHVTHVIGCVGGPMQPQGHVQLISHLIDGGLSPQAALDRPRAQWFDGDLVGVEEGFGPEVLAALRSVGFDVIDPAMPPDLFGVGQIVEVHDDGWLEGGSDRRHDGFAVGRL